MRHPFYSALILVTALVHGPANAANPQWTYGDQNQPGGWGALTSSATPPP